MKLNMNYIYHFIEILFIHYMGSFLIEKHG